MKKFLFYFFWWCFLPVAVYATFVFVTDPLKCFRPYKEYYRGSFVSPNRENVCLQLFEQTDNRKEINSFILGNSCSHAFKVRYWEAYLPSGSKGFHLDAYRETIYGILKKLEYLDRNGSKIENVLLVLDESTFSKKLNSYMYVIPKRLDPDSSMFYTEHLKVLTSVKFMGAFCYYALFREDKSFMEEFKFTSKQPISDNQTGDLYYLTDNEIRADSLLYFKKIQVQDWVQRKNMIELIGSDSYEGLSTQNLNYIKKIKAILSKHKTNYRVIINPLYNQKKLPSEMINTLNFYFGNKFVYDFSGVNTITSNYTNFYDGVHYRPVVAEKITDFIYSAKPLN